AVGRNHDFAKGTGIFVIAGNIVFIERLTIDVDLPVFNADAVAGDSNDPLDVALRSVARIAEHDDVAALDRLPAIHKLVDKDALLIFKARHHAGAFHFHRLVEKDNDKSRDGE